MINVLTGERYKSITKETAGVLKGEYGAAPAEVNAELQARVLDGKEAVTCRPADLLKAELHTLTDELLEKAKEENIELAEQQVDDVLTYALFPQVGLKFLKNRNNPDAFEPAPGTEKEAEKEEVKVSAAKGSVEAYSVKVDGQVYNVEVGPQGVISSVEQISAQAAQFNHLNFLQWMLSLLMHHWLVISLRY